MDPDALVADLDASQRAAVITESRLVAVIAGAGSGKTRVLTRRIAYRIATGSADARHTLALTFTREAAGEMRKRLLRLGLRERVEAGTFHSVMLAVLKQRWTDTDRRPQTIVSERRRLLTDAMGGEHRHQLAAVLAEIDWATARGIAPGDYASVARRTNRRPGPGVDRCAAAYTAFDTLKKRRGVIDFDDVLAHVIRDMRRDPDFADGLRWRFRHVVVDEAQDLNPLQHALVDLLRAGRDDLFMVGDPAQAIYGFNGADPGLLVDVEQRFPGVEVIRLPVNHRSTPQVVDAGRHVLAAGDQPFDLRSGRGDGAPVTDLVADDDGSEVSAVVSAIGHVDPNLVRTGEVAVLARTNAQLGPFADALTRRGIAVRRSATAAGSPLQVAVRTAAALGSASQLRGWAHDLLDSFDGPPHPQQHDDSGDPPPERRVAAAVLEFLREQPLGDGATFRAWVATSNPFDDTTTNGVDLLTFHAAKGREWHTVFVTGVETSLVPHKSAHTAADRAEEARLLYVACTRATDHLVLSRATRRGGYARAVSPFIAELDLDAATASAPPPPRARPHRVADSLLVGLQAWRDDAARRANILPTQVCTDRDLQAIARARPRTAGDLAAVTSFGPMTAERLAPSIVEIVVATEAADPSGATERRGAGGPRQPARSTITGA